MCFAGSLLLFDVCGFRMLVDLFGCGFGVACVWISCLGFGYLCELLVWF